MRNPRFSVLVPTRNRAGLLRHAVTTVLGQTVEDLEVVVADNASTDNTPAVVAELDDGRVRHERLETPIPLVENWERAAALARGEWVLVLGDDDGFVPTLLERVLPSLEAGHRVVAWRKAWYVHPDAEAPWPDPGAVNHLVVDPWTGRAEEVDARAELSRLFRRRERDVRPEVNAVVHRSVLANVRAAAGRVYGAPDPACGFSAAVLATEHRYLALDLPLLVMGLSAASISSAFARDLAAPHEVVQEYAGDELFREVPLQVRAVANLMAESLLRARRAMPEHLGWLELDWVRYFVTCHDELSRPDRRHDGGAALAQWRAALARQPRHVQTAVRRALRHAQVVGTARRVARAVPLARTARRAFATRFGDGAGHRVVAGTEAGFSDLPGAARWIDAALLPPIGRRSAVPSGGRS